MAALLLVYMLFVARGFKIAMLADDGFSKLLAVGLTFAFALQTFIIVGGILRIIPLTGITLPFVSYGGSSVVANFVLARGPPARLQPRQRGARMNRQIARLALVGLGLVAALIVATTYWQTWATAGLADRQDNEIQRVAQFSIKRGLIRAADGTILATNRKKHVGGQTLYFRRYPQHGLFAHIVGYSTQSRSRSGLEASENDYLTGSNANLHTVLNTTLDRIRGATIKGNDLWLTLRPGAQRLAMQQLAGNCGSVVALDTQTGAVLVAASRPTFDPNLVESNFGAINNIRASCSPAAPLLNRATDGLFTPGSTFKVVTASAALDTGSFTPDSRFDDPGYCIEYGKKVRNAGNPEAPETFGSVDLTTGLEHSINSVFCNIGKTLGAGQDPRLREALRLLRRPSARDSRERARAERPLPRAQAVPPDAILPLRSTQAGSLSGRRRCWRRRCRWRWSPRVSPTSGVVMKPYVVGRITGPNGGRADAARIPTSCGARSARAPRRS